MSASHRWDGDRTQPRDKVFDNADKVWVHDMAFDAQGRPVIVFADFVSTTDHRYATPGGRGTRWVPTRSRLPAGRSTSTARGSPTTRAITLDHENPNTVYLSRDVGGVFEE